MAGLKVYQLTSQGTLLGTDWLVVQRGTDPAKKRNINDILNDGLSVSFNDGEFVGIVKTGGLSLKRYDLGDKIIMAQNSSGTIVYSQIQGTTDEPPQNIGLDFYTTQNAGTSLNRSLHIFGNGNATLLGTMTASGYIPFTGCHIAKSNEDLKLGELVQIKSVGWINPKQPDWIAEYCNGSKKGVYGIVYGIEEKENEETQYLIAAVGDGFIEVDCPCEYGDWLIPSETKGLATVYKGAGYPRNFVGIAGEDSEGGKISWVKE